MLKLNDVCVMMLPLVVVGCTSKPAPSVMREATTPPAWIMQPPRLADTAERIISPSERADHYAKQLKGNPYIINEQCR